MRSRWTLAVEGLGRIGRAEVEVRPLTLFVGENNSGKSYLASLLWDFYARMPEVFSFSSDELPELEASAQYQRLAERISGATSSASGEEDTRALVTWVAERLGQKRDAIVQRLFGRTSMQIKHLALSGWSRSSSPSGPPEPPHAFRIGAIGDVKFTNVLLRGHRPPGVLYIPFGPDGSTSKEAIAMMLVASAAGLFSRHNIGELGSGYVAGDPIYLPASRTGFMLLYRGVLSNLIDRGMTSFSGAKPAPATNVTLTVPQAHFLQLLALGLKSDHRGPHADEADLIERHAFPGTVAFAGVGVNEVEYRYDPTTPPLPMQLSSSLVTELAPLILVLRHASALPMLFLEEPEAHLHPHLVRLVARVVARLVRKGVQVCITTHSADFCQQINNFIKLGSLPPEERARFQAEYGYDADDYLDASEVGGYQFRVGPNGRSTVTPLDESPSGLAMPTFNEELFALSQQTLALQRAVEDEA